jgi:hypothetical protein
MRLVAALEGRRRGERVVSVSCVANGVVVIRVAQCHQCPLCDGWMACERLHRGAAVVVMMMMTTPCLALLDLLSVGWLIVAPSARPT